MSYNKNLYKVKSVVQNYLHFFDKDMYTNCNKLIIWVNLFLVPIKLRYFKFSPNVNFVQV